MGNLMKILNAIIALWSIIKEAKKVIAWIKNIPWKKIFQRKDKERKDENDPGIDP